MAWEVLSLFFRFIGVANIVWAMLSIALVAISYAFDPSSPYDRGIRDRVPSVPLFMNLYWLGSLFLAILLFVAGYHLEKGYRSGEWFSLVYGGSIIALGLAWHYYDRTYVVPAIYDKWGQYNILMANEELENTDLFFYHNVIQSLYGISLLLCVGFLKLVRSFHRKAPV